MLKAAWHFRQKCFWAKLSSLHCQGHSRSYRTSSIARTVFGIDFGTHFARIAVYDHKKNRPFVLPNKIDGGEGWECVVAKDNSSPTSANAQWLVGKKAVEMMKISRKKGVGKLKALLAAQYDNQLLKEWKHEYGDQRVVSSRRDDHQKVSQSVSDELKVRLDDDSNFYRPVELASHIFAALRTAAEEYLLNNESDTSQQRDESVKRVEAYISVPYTWTEKQREALIEAAEIARIHVLKLIPEPLAALANVRRIEYNGLYCFCDFGDKFRVSLVRMYDGKFDIVGYAESDPMRSIVEPEIINYLKYQFKKEKPFEGALILKRPSIKSKLRELAQIVNLDLAVRPQTIVELDNVGIVVSREARQVILYSPMKKLHDVLRKALKSANITGTERKRITHVVLIGANSVYIPATADAIEQFFNMTLSRTVAHPSCALAVGTAIFAAQERGEADAIWKGRDVTRLGHILPNAQSRVTEMTFDELEESLMFGYDSVLPAALTFHNVAQLYKWPRLQPLWNDRGYQPPTGFESISTQFQREYYSPSVMEERKNPIVSLSFGQITDPFSGEREYWARINVRAVADTFKELANANVEPQPEDLFRRGYWVDPYEKFYRINPYSRPLIKTHIVIDIRAPPLFSMAPSLPEVIKDWDDFIDKTGIDEHFQMNRMILSADPITQKFEKEEKIRLLQSLREQLKKPHYRALNRAHDALQFILANFNDSDIIAVSVHSKNGFKLLSNWVRMEKAQVPQILSQLMETHPHGIPDITKTTDYAFSLFTAEDKNARRQFPEHLETRILLLTDCPPKLSEIRRWEFALRKGYIEKGASATLISVAGGLFDDAAIRAVRNLPGGSFVDMRHIHTEAWRKKWDRSGQALFLNALLPRFYNVKVWLDFENYEIERIYGYNYQIPHINNVKDLLEAQSTPVVDAVDGGRPLLSKHPEFFSVTEKRPPDLFFPSLHGTYVHDKEEAFDFDRAELDEFKYKVNYINKYSSQLEEEQCILLLKLRRKPPHRCIERLPYWTWNGKANTTTTDVIVWDGSTMPDTRSTFTFRVEFNDRVGRQLIFTRTCRINEHYNGFEEPGVKRAVLIAKEIEVLRKGLHARYMEELRPLRQQLQQQYSQEPQSQKQPLFSLPEITLDVRYATAPLTPSEEKALQTFYLRDVDAKYYIDSIGRKISHSFVLPLDWSPTLFKFWLWYTKQLREPYDERLWWWVANKVTFASLRENDHDFRLLLSLLLFSLQKRENSAPKQMRALLSAFLLTGVYENLKHMANSLVSTIIRRKKRSTSVLYKLPRTEQYFLERQQKATWKLMEIIAHPAARLFLRLSNFVYWISVYADRIQLPHLRLPFEKQRQIESLEKVDTKSFYLKVRKISGVWVSDEALAKEIPFIYDLLKVSIAEMEQKQQQNMKRFANAELLWFRRQVESIVDLVKEMLDTSEHATVGFGRIDLKEFQEELEDLYKKATIEGSGGWIKEEDQKNMTSDTEWLEPFWIKALLTSLDQIFQENVRQAQQQSQAPPQSQSQQQQQQQQQSSQQNTQTERPEEKTEMPSPTATQTQTQTEAGQHDETTKKDKEK
jgi:molecular chaperone DnaK (HSP70)/ribosomal protein L12E/L44/L45/RPP1/RPP2